jgi:hypothetical protein
MLALCINIKNPLTLKGMLSLINGMIGLFQLFNFNPDFP